MVHVTVCNINTCSGTMQNNIKEFRSLLRRIKFTI